MCFPRAKNECGPFGKLLYTKEEKKKESYF